MSWSVRLLGLLAVLVVLAAPRAVSACPFCKEAVAASSEQGAVVEEDDPFREARAYNGIILVMVVMPYLLLGTVGFLVYRGLKRKVLAEQPAGPGAEGEQPCPRRSRGEPL